MYNNIREAFYHGKKTFGNMYNSALKYAGQLDSAVSVGKRLYSVIHPMLSRNMNNAIMSGISQFDEGKASIVGHHNNIENQLMRIRRTVPEIGI